MAENIRHPRVFRDTKQALNTPIHLYDTSLFEKPIDEIDQFPKKLLEYDTNPLRATNTITLKNMLRRQNNGLFRSIKCGSFQYVLGKGNRQAYNILFG